VRICVVPITVALIIVALIIVALIIGTQNVIVWVAL
jgi:hypothetical protein